MTDAMITLKNENTDLRRLLLRVASALYETEGIQKSAANKITSMIIDEYKLILEREGE